jgi:hypothetical protein
MTVKAFSTAASPALGCQALTPLLDTKKQLTALCNGVKAACAARQRL